MALYVVRVPQAGPLPTASFRFHLTMDTLAVQLMVATANPIADFHCQAIIHARHTRLPRLYRRGTHLDRLSSIPTCREFALIPTLIDGEFPLEVKQSGEFFLVHLLKQIKVGSLAVIT